MTQQAAHVMTDDEVQEFFGEKPLRWYQVAARNATIQALANGEKRILVVLPTGAGKTITVACTMGDPEILKAMKITDRKIRVLFVAHKHRLLTQAEQTFATENNVELIVQSMFSDIPADTIKAGWDLCVLDEAHHEACSTFQYQLEKIGDFPIIGLTATPDRADGCLIKFDVIINPISREQAVEQGYLAETNIHSFVDAPTKEKVDVLSDVFNSYAHQMGQTMVFVKTKKEVAAITTVLQSLGYEAVGVLNQTERELNTILNDFSDGRVQFIVNCNKINEGVDVVGCTDVVLGRQFGSYSQLNQVIGRAARPDSECNVWELINPLSGRNLDTTVVVGTPEYHRLVSRERNDWIEREFNYVSHRTNKQLGIASGIRIRH
jgi:superfamily II DNA or RNA helicase